MNERETDEYKKWRLKCLYELDNYEAQREYNKKLMDLAHEYTKKKNAYNFIKIKNNILQNRIDKAIEFINEHIRIDDEYPAYMEMHIEERDDLLNILKGDEE